jgi:RHS repeat-associated protein
VRCDRFAVPGFARTAVSRAGSAEQTVYDLEYKYDQLGNRLWKKDHVGGGETVYLYDTNLEYTEGIGLEWTGYHTEVADPYFPPVPAEEFWTRNNRLLHYTQYDGSGALQGTLDTAGAAQRRGPRCDLWAAPGRPRQGGPVHYTYYQTGHVSNITIRDGDPREAGSEDTWVCHDLGLFYSTDGKVTRARWSQWDENSEGPVAESLEYTAARRFSYNGPRQRYLTWEADPTTWELLEESPGEPTQTWTTYLGDMPWADFTVDADWNPIKVRDYLTGNGLHAQIDGATGDVEFFHSDLIGSTMLRTDDSGEPVSGISGITYTAFGEPVFNDGSGWQVGGALPEGYPRYAYAGQFGYESDLLTVQGTNETLAPVTLAHVGCRWYQAGIGRFVQRDPAGLEGGLNPYVYCRNNALTGADPLGLWSWGGAGTGAGAGAAGGAITGGLIGGPAGALIGGILGGVGGFIGGGLWGGPNLGTAGVAFGGGALVGLGTGYIVVCVTAAPVIERIGDYVLKNGQVIGKITEHLGGVVGEGTETVRITGGKIINVPKY